MLAWEYANSAVKAQIHELSGVYYNRVANFDITLRIPLNVADVIILEQYLGRTHANEFIRAVDPWCYPGEKTQAVAVLKHCVQKPCTDRLFPKMGECREVLGGGPAPP